MKKVLFVLCAVLLMLVVGPFFYVKADTESNEIIYLYKNKNQLTSTNIQTLEAQGIKVTAINIDKLDNMKYFYRYQAAYDFTDDVKLPLIIAGNECYAVEDFDSVVDEIVISSQNPLKDLSEYEVKIVIYFYSPSCSNCNYLENETDVFKRLTNAGVKIVYVNILNTENLQYFQNYVDVYGYGKATTPFMFAGSKYYHSAKVIEDNVDDIIDNAKYDLLNVEYKPLDTSKYQGFLGFLLILVAGLIDGVNPCAIAMLILFISLLIGVSSNRRTIIAVATSYILGLFVMYFITGLFLMNVVSKLGPYISNLSFYINIFIIVFSLIFAFLNFYDFYMAKRQEYGRIKNQLPKRIQKFNKKIIKIFTESLNNKKNILLYLIPFALGVIISLTEFLCTGQVYLPVILTLAHSKHSLSGILLLFMYNLMFVLPLVIISVVVIKTQSAMQASNTVREKMHLIKLATSILFLGMAIYYILIVTGVI